MEKFLIWKNIGETPLEALSRLRALKNISDDVPMTYAGRLDPAAEGLLLILLGDECKKKDLYTSLDKTYRAEILLGASTDSYDLLGIPLATPVHGEHFSESLIESFLQSQVGTHAQTYPPYSSKTVDGKQLHTHAKEGTSVLIPEHSVTLYEYSGLSFRACSSEILLERVNTITNVVHGDFRQEEIRAAWSAFARLAPRSWVLLSVTLNVGSGFYIRQCAEDLGRALGTGACLYSLVRTTLGEYTKADCE